MSLRHKFFVLASAGLIALGAFGEASARPKSSSGSRGTHTSSTPPVTNAAPKAAAPMERTATPATAPTSAASAAKPAAAAPAAGGFLSGGLGKGLLGGLIGAGLIGMLMGNGLGGGLGGLTSMIGLLLQVGLIFLVIKLALNFFRNRQQPALQGAPMQSTSYGNGPLGGSGNAPLGGAMGRAASPPPPVTETPLQVAPADYDVFERRLGEVQDAYSREDIETLKKLATPEMVGYFSDDLAENARKGVVNRTNGAKLLQGDLAEAWREQEGEFATVAMKYTLLDIMIDRATNNIVSGDANVPDNVTEIWTFWRPTGSGPSNWMLSAIQQA
jgi:predicted lipid-binding transport protein (Tim44 family)